LLVEHAGVGLLAVRIEQSRLGKRVAHALEHHLQEQGFELLRGALERRLWITRGGALERVERARVGRQSLYGVVEQTVGIERIHRRTRRGLRGSMRMRSTCHLEPEAKDLERPPGRDRLFRPG